MIYFLAAALRSVSESKHLFRLLPPTLFIASCFLECRADSPKVIDICEEDLLTHPPDGLVAAVGKESTALNQRVAQRLLDFRIMRLGGLEAAIFRTLHASRGRQSKKRGAEEDHSFRVWAPEAAANGVQVGAYWYYRQGVAVQEQVEQFLEAIRRACRIPRRYISSGESATPLVGKRILLVVNSANHDRLPGEPDVAVLRRTLDALRELRKQTGVWPGYYPEMGSRENGGLTPVFATAARDLTADELADYRKCWLWISSFSAEPEEYAMPAFEHIWPTWTLWQYCPAETWRRKGRRGWIPAITPREDYAGGFANLAFPEYPRGIMGAAIPLDCNRVNVSRTTVAELWNRHGWIASPE